MSASNWAICPQCLDRAKTAAAERFQASVDAYGKVPADEYERLRDSAQTVADPEDFRTFREDYEFYGADEGTVTASYSAHCSTCALAVDFEYERAFYSASSCVPAETGNDT